MSRFGKNLEKPADRIRYHKALLRSMTAARIQNLLDDLGLTQAELASRLNKSRAWVSKVLGRHQNLTLDSLAEIGFALGVEWSLEPVGIERAGTSAEGDPELPDWVHREQPRPFREVGSPAEGLMSWFAGGQLETSLSESDWELVHHDVMEVFRKSSMEVVILPGEWKPLTEPQELGSTVYYVNKTVKESEVEENAS